jgi:hypothetical protein
MNNAHVNRVAGPFRPMVLVMALVVAACGGSQDSDADSAQAIAQGSTHEQFWQALHAHCGQAFGGSIAEGNQSDTTFAGKALVMHVRECSADTVRIPFHVGDDRSRTWVVTRTESGLRLKHDHRHSDGSEDSVTQYGGDTRDEGTAERQEFYADAYTAELIPAASTNVWTMEIVPNQRFAYALRREGTDRRFRVEFDLTQTVPAPPAPWGFED